MQYGLATYQADDATRPAFVFEGRLVDLSDVIALWAKELHACFMTVSLADRPWSVILYM